MPMLQIPVQCLPGALWLITADEFVEETIRAQLTLDKPQHDLEAFIDSVVSQSKAEPNKIAGIVDFLLWAGFQRQNMTNEPPSVPQFIKLVLDAVVRQVSKIEISEEQEKRFSRIVSEFLLARTSFGLSAKANIIMTQSERNYIRGRVISDIRPIFDEDKIDCPIASVITHLLKIDYLEGGFKKEFFVGLDFGEILELERILERAKLKHNQLKMILQRAQVDCIDVAVKASQ